MGQAEDAQDAQDAHAHFSFEVPAWHAASVATSTATATATATFLLHKQHVYLKDAGRARESVYVRERERARVLLPLSGVRLIVKTNHTLMAIKRSAQKLAWHTSCMYLFCLSLSLFPSLSPSSTRIGVACHRSRCLSSTH